MNALDIEGLSVRYGDRVALSDVSLSIAPGEIVALLGPSGSGKSTLALAVPRLLPSHAVVEGRIRVNGEEVSALDGAALRRLRGGRVGLVFQEPATALNPALTIGRQIEEALAAHGVPGSAAGLLARVGLAVSPGRYPHTLSGGQRQRVVIAVAIAAGPSLLIADEPTASLDPAATRKIITLLQQIARERATPLLLITHDRALATRAADRLIDWTAPAENARFSYPPVQHRPAADAPILSMERVSRSHAGRPALVDCSLDLRAGETLAVIGRSGAGKSTLARLALGLDRPDSGTVRSPGRGRVQAVFQDPAASFDPRQTVGRIVGEALHLLRPADAPARVAAALAVVGLPADPARRLPQAFSGGQRQRIAIARAIVAEPELIVLDEALSALDEALRHEMVALLLRLQAERGIAYLLIAHDMALVRAMAHRVLVLEEGCVVEQGPAAELLDNPGDPATQALVG